MGIYVDDNAVLSILSLSWQLECVEVYICPGSIVIKSASVNIELDETDYISDLLL